MDRCEEKAIHVEKVKKVVSRLPEQNTLEGVAEIFKALSDPGRVKIVLALASEELCVCDLAVVCNLSDSAVSHQLRILRNLKIVRNRRIRQVANRCKIADTQLFRGQGKNNLYPAGVA